MPFRSTRTLIALMVLAGNSAILADDAPSFFSKFQFHANVSQGFLFSSDNNYLTTDSSDGSAKWTEAALSLSRPITDKLRAGVQVHSYSLGQLGRQRVTLDWAYADYKLSRYFGVRAGKVKTPTGLYNDVQDIDAVYQWVLLPQGMYPADLKGFLLSHEGGIVYGEVSPSKKFGSIEYQGFGGLRSQSRVEGFATTMAEQGVQLGTDSGPMAGADVRWRTGLEGLMLGASYVHTDLSAPDSKAGPYPFPIETIYSMKHVYAQYERGKMVLSGEWRTNPLWLTIGPYPQRYTPNRAWYAMATYRVASKLSMGSYFEDSLCFLSGGRDRTDPLNYQKDLAVNGRYDFNRYLYLKLEGHYMQGVLWGFYSLDNPNGYQKDTRLVAARVGFTI